MVMTMPSHLQRPRFPVISVENIVSDGKASVNLTFGLEKESLHAFLMNHILSRCVSNFVFHV